MSILLLLLPFSILLCYNYRNNSEPCKFVNMRLSCLHEQTRKNAMRIGELKPKQNITLLVNANGIMLTFESCIQEVLPLKNLIYADAVLSNEKPVSFRGKNVMVSLLVYFDEEKPILFKNVYTKLFRRGNGSFCYGITSLAEGHLYNRRDNFRCYIGLESSIQCGSNTAAHPAIIRDVSSTGFAVVCAPDFSLDTGQIIHTVLNDRPREDGDSYSFHLYGIVTRIQKLENGQILYGCQLNKTVHGLDKYIMEKERLRLKNTHGGKL